jgi:hypothetical protein
MDRQERREAEDALKLALLSLGPNTPEEIKEKLKSRVSV